MKRPFKATVSQVRLRPDTRQSFTVWSITDIWYLRKQGVILYLLSKHIWTYPYFHFGVLKHDKTESKGIESNQAILSVNYMWKQTILIKIHGSNVWVVFFIPYVFPLSICWDCVQCEQNRDINIFVSRSNQKIWTSGLGP
jgi:hypothetical protein